MNTFRLNTHSHLIFLWFVFLVIFLNCRGEKPEQSTQLTGIEDAQNKTSVILKIEDNSYVNADFESFARNMVGEEMDFLTPVTLSRLVDSFIEEKLLLHAAQKMNLSLTW